MKRNPTLPPNFMLGYAIAAPNLQNYGFQGRRGLVFYLQKYAPGQAAAHHEQLQSIERSLLKQRN
ncbi:hypothetical protein [Nostoc sp.]|uniref:hypothetical protein n=1 Tax=Nostoc sp. TaxID=1180 RepID=UPI002FFC69F5